MDKTQAKKFAEGHLQQAAGLIMGVAVIYAVDMDDRATAEKLMDWANNVSRITGDDSFTLDGLIARRQEMEQKFREGGDEALAAAILLALLGER